MQYRQLGRSGLRVSVLSMGTATFGGTGSLAMMGTTDVAEATRQVTICIDAGVNLFDTANTYSAGISEQILGEALRGRRDQVLVATKGRGPTGNGPNDRGVSRHYLVEQCEKSLRRLNTDYIDLYQLHSWDGHTPLDETLRALEDLQRSGKIRYFGVSNYSGWHLMKSLMISERERFPRIVSQQIYYSLVNREAEHELIPVGIDQGIGVLVWGPLAGGLLSGKYRRNQVAPQGARYTTAWDEPPIADWEEIYDVVDAVVSIAERRGNTPSQVALAWLLAKPGVSSLVIGARTTAQLESNLAVVGLALSAEEVALLDRASRKPLPYPYWHQSRAASDRLSAADLSLLAPYVRSA